MTQLIEIDSTHTLVLPDDEPKPKSGGDVLREAAAEVTRRGLHRGGFVDKTNRIVKEAVLGGVHFDYDKCAVCAIGALNVVLTEGADPSGYSPGWLLRETEAGIALAAYLKALYPQESHPEFYDDNFSGDKQFWVPTWNDDYRRTAEDVAKAFLAAAELADQQDAARKTAKELRDSAEVVRERGWFQGGFYNALQFDNGAMNFSEAAAKCAVCAMGAVGVVTQDGDPVLMSERKGAARALSQFLGGDIGVWNDKPGRTVEEVLEAFELTAQRVEREAGL